MWSYTFRRILATIPTLLAVVTVCYLLLHATPGGPFDSERKVSAAVLANLQAKYQLDQPLWQQYLHYLNNLLHGDLGASFRYADWSVNELVANALPVSAAIGGGAIVTALFVGIFLGTIAALRQNSAVDGAALHALQAQQFGLHFAADDRVQRRERLVHQQDRRVGGQRPRQADALLQAARKFVGVAGSPAGQAHLFQRLRGQRPKSSPSRHAASRPPAASS